MAGEETLIWSDTIVLLIAEILFVVGVALQAGRCTAIIKSGGGDSFVGRACQADKRYRTAIYVILALMILFTIIGIGVMTSNIVAGGWIIRIPVYIGFVTVAVLLYLISGADRVAAQKTAEVVAAVGSVEI